MAEEKEVKEIVEENCITFNGKEYPIVSKGVDLPVKYVKQFSLVYKNIKGKNESEVFEYFMSDMTAFVDTVGFLLSHFIGKEKMLEIAPQGLDELPMSQLIQLADATFKRVLK